MAISPISNGESGSSVRTKVNAAIAKANLVDDKANATDVNDGLALKANKNSPEFTGTPTAPTQSFGNATERLATTEFVNRRQGEKGADIASASSMDLSAATGDYVDITGTVTINSLGTVAAGVERTLRFMSALTLTHSSALVLPGAANIVTANGDTAIFRSEGSGNWRCVSYQRADGTPLAGHPSKTSLTDPVAPNILFDPFNEAIYEDGSLAGYGHVPTGGFTTGSGNIPLSTPKLRAASGNLDRQWNFAHLGAQPGDVINLLVLCWFATSGGLVGVYIRDGSSNVLASHLATGRPSGLQVVPLQVTVPASGSTTLLVRANSTGAIELGGFAAAIGNQRPSLGVGRVPQAYRQAMRGTSQNLLPDPFNENYALSGGAELTGPLSGGLYAALAGSVRSSSPNSPWGTPGIYSAYSGSTVTVRRIFFLKGLGLRTGDVLRARALAHAAATLSSFALYVRNSVGGSLLTAQNSDSLSFSSGLNDIFTRSFVLPANADHILFEATCSAGDVEFLAFALGRDSLPAFGQAALPMSRYGRVRRQRNLAPDPFYRCYTGGLTTIDGYPLCTEEVNVVTLASSPYKPKKAMLFSGGAARNRNIDVKRLGLQLGEKVTIKLMMMFPNDAPSGFNFGFYLRKADGTVLQNDVVALDPAKFKAGVIETIIYTMTVTQSHLDDAAYWQFRYNVSSVAVTGGFYLIATGIYIGEENPLLDDAAFAEDDLRLQIAALSASLTANTNPTPNNYKAKNLRETRQRFALRDFDENSRVVHMAIGDSYTHNKDRWTGPLLTRIQARKNDAGNVMGDGGGGWTGFGDLSANAGTFNNGNVRSSYGYSRSGTWTTDSIYFNSGGPDLGAITSSEVGARVTLTKPASPAHSNAKLYWKGTADGVVRYSWDGGSTWTTQNVQGTVGSLGTAGLTVGMPAGAGTLIIEVVSGTVTLFGLEWISTANGYVLHKCGATGSSSANWAGVNAALWQSCVAALAPNLVSIMLGTNDNNGGMSKSVFKANLETVIQRTRLAAPAADIWLIAVAQTPRVLSLPMSDYATAMYELAQTYRCAFTWLQDVFGDPANPTEYASNGIRPWFTDDGSDGLASTDIHPNPVSGGRAIVADLYKTVFYYP